MDGRLARGGLGDALLRVTTTGTTATTDACPLGERAALWISFRSRRPPSSGCGKIAKILRAMSTIVISVQMNRPEHVHFAYETLIIPLRVEVVVQKCAPHFPSFLSSVKGNPIRASGETFPLPPA